jgi:hypothetical protein
MLCLLSLGGPAGAAHHDGSPRRTSPDARRSAALGCEELVIREADQAVEQGEGQAADVAVAEGRFQVLAVDRQTAIYLATLE